MWIINADREFCKILSILSKDIERKILTSIKGHNSVINLRKITGSNPNLEFVNISAYTKFDEILSFHSKDIKQKRHSDINQRP